MEYDESSYPANAESESEGDDHQLQAPAAVESQGEGEELDSEVMDAGTLPDDVLCIVCGEVLVEPCSLHCGHTFCQLCLAALWKSHKNKSPLYLHCPVCRQPWVNFPGVNIQLRYVMTIERSVCKYV